MTARINTSKITTDGVEVVWSDGLKVLFDVNDINANPTVYNDTEWPLDLAGTMAEVDRRVVVSRTSAKVAATGCGVAA